MVGRAPKSYPRRTSHKRQGLSADWCPTEMTSRPEPVAGLIALFWAAGAALTSCSCRNWWPGHRVGSRISSPKRHIACCTGGVTTRVCIESGTRRVFASALDWPGWCRSGRTEEQALETLATYAARYAPVAASAGLRFEPELVEFEVVERAKGNVTTDVGAPGIISAAEYEPLDATGAADLASLVAACWPELDRAARGAPAELRKGFRGGGRDRDEIIDHVANAELAYVRKLGIRLGSDLAASRAALVTVLSSPSEGRPLVAKGWPPRYAARRIAWHVLDHAWEIEDKSQ